MTFPTMPGTFQEALARHHVTDKMLTEVFTHNTDELARWTYLQHLRNNPDHDGSKKWDQPDIPREEERLHIDRIAREILLLIDAHVEPADFELITEELVARGFHKGDIQPALIFNTKTWDDAGFWKRVAGFTFALTDAGREKLVELKNETVA